MRWHANKLHELGVRKIINMCIEYQGPAATYRKLGIEQLHLPTPDFTPPNLDSVLRAIEFIELHQQEGVPIYLHCKAGRGRSPTVALCWIMKSLGLSAEDAEDHIRRHRPYVDKNLSKRDVVISFAECIESGKAPAVY